MILKGSNLDCGQGVIFTLLVTSYSSSSNFGYDRGLDFTFSSGGQFTGTDTLGCMYSGNIFVDDASVGLYRMEATPSGCNLTNELNGYLYKKDSLTFNGFLMSTEAGIFVELQ